MPRVRVKIPKEPKVIEMPAHLLPNYAPQTEVVEASAQVKEVPIAAPQPPVIEPERPAVTPPEPSVLEPRTRQDIGKSVTLSYRKLAIGFAGLTILMVFALGVVRNSSDTPEGTLGASTAGLSEDERYYQEVSKIVELPEGQVPRVVNISDAAAVKKDNVALGDIKNGDKMLFFTQSRKVVVYRPDTKKVIAVVSLATPDSTTTSTPNNN